MPSEYLMSGKIPKLCSLYMAKSVRPPCSPPVIGSRYRAIKLEITLIKTEPKEIAYLFYCVFICHYVTTVVFQM